MLKLRESSITKSASKRNLTKIYIPLQGVVTENKDDSQQL